ncbi:uncharacterized protein GBIM_19676 [Gryllus bimaculatus]|nr:uncharacterized protein GBIM_19676 [Gryllus bimaculatus]
MEENIDSLEDENGSFPQHLEADVVQEVLKSGTDLRQYSLQIEKKLKEVENKSIQDYIKESQNIASLHNQIAACDSILERMESMLLSFQSDLGSISSEILYLQRKSVSMSQQLNNRQGIRGQLSQFIDDIAVSDSLMGFFYEFLLTHERCVAQKVRKEYVDTMSKIYYSYFSTYSKRLKGLQYEDSATKKDLMGIEDTASRVPFMKSSLKQKNTVFTIGNRGEVLATQFEAPIIVPHAAQEQDMRYPFEALFRSEQYALVDNACREYLFVTEFFMVRGTQAQDLFDKILGRTLNLLVENLEKFVQESYDAIALFLCVHLVLRYQLLCHKRAVPALDRYWDGLQALIWPRFERIIRMNIESVQNCDTLKFSKELRPHYITRRYAEFSAAIVSISETFPNELVNRLLAELQEQVEFFILRMAAIFPQRKEQLIFLINNYEIILGVLMERTRDTSKEADSFRDQLNSCSNEYVEEILSPHFGGIMQFVKEGEALLEKGQTEDLKAQEGKALALVQSFSSNWKQSLEELNQEVLTSFPSLLTSSSLLQLAFKQLVQYYHRFHKLLSPTARGQLTNIHLIIVEIKRYKTNF